MTSLFSWLSPFRGNKPETTSSDGSSSNGGVHVHPPAAPAPAPPSPVDEAKQARAMITQIEQILHNELSFLDSNAPASPARGEQPSRKRRIKTVETAKQLGLQPRKARIGVMRYDSVRGKWTPVRASSSSSSSSSSPSDTAAFDAALHVAIPSVAFPLHLQLLQ
eukprot:TRINITY_DN1034_c0_g1_i1.p1 TRINITY_DN1034_c0_g1~~TRINITY_DN1034_c0_g1_i1.p1  ORF type:complete len:164 (-),score=38.15 TRINITY_DN1034_c0_g1_i1:57-548(-)